MIFGLLSKIFPCDTESKGGEDDKNTRLHKFQKKDTRPGPIRSVWWHYYNHQYSNNPKGN